MSVSAPPLLVKILLRICVFCSLLFLFPNASCAFGQSYSGSADFGTVNVGASSGIQTLTFNFVSMTSLNITTPVQVLTMGTAGLDFKSAGTGTCGGSSYTSCTVDVVFSPTVPGTRLGAVVIEDMSGNVLVTAYVHGIGSGPQIAFDPGVQSAIGSGMSSPQGIAVDGAGNSYIADFGSGSIYKVTPGGAQTTVATGFTQADGLTIDGAGNLYVAFDSTSITKITPTGVKSSIGSGLSLPAGMAMDGAGDLYIACVGSNNIVKVTPSGTQTSLGTGLNTPAGVAVDSSGNLYVADTSNGRIIKIAPDGSQTPVVGPPFSFPESVALDGGGNLYAALYNGEVYEITPSGGVNLMASNLSVPAGITVDGAGNFYVAQGSSALKFDRNTPPTVAFLTSDIGVTSSDSPKTVTIDNIGNANLTFSIPFSGTNPVISSDFSLGGASTCPQLTSSSTVAGTLASDTSCVYSISFTPTTTGTITGSLVVADNALNVANASQSITLNNQGVPVVIQATVTVNTVVANYTGSPIPVTVTTSPSGLNVAITYTPLGASTGSSVDPSAAGIYVVTAVVTTPGYSGTGSGYLIINSPPPPPAPVITWATPSPIALGTPLSATQLNATANTAGTFTYSPALGTILGVGTHTLSVTFVPTDTTDFAPSATATVMLVVQGYVQAIPASNLGNVNIASTSASTTVTFTFTNSVTLNSTSPVEVLTQGAPDLDFRNTGAGTCAAGNYAVNASCTVTVTFTPAAAGVREGAVVLLDNSGNTVATAYLYGVGLGSQIAYGPGAQSVIPNSASTLGVAADAAGNLYLNAGGSLPGSNPVIKVAPGGTQTTVGTGVSSEGGIAVDGAGNVYIADTFNNRVVEFATNGVAYTLGSGFNTPYGVAVDGAANVYVADTKNGQVVKIAPDGTQSTVGTGYVYPEAVAVDASGNLYVADNASLPGQSGSNGLIYKIPSGGSQSIFAAGLLDPSSIAIDAAGNLYITGDTNQTVAMITPSGVKTTLVSGLNFPSEVTVDGGGNLYISDPGNPISGVLKIDRSTTPALTFSSTSVGSISSDSPQAITIQNIGNEVLNFPQPVTGTNAAISANFVLFPSTTCPHSASASSVATGGACVYSVEFLPSALGNIAGSLILTDNALNEVNATQTIALTGTGTTTTTTATVTLGNLSQTYTGLQLAATATTIPAGLTVSITYNGSATAPTAAGSYAVVATITSAGYAGSATGTLIIAKATPAIAWTTPTAITYGSILGTGQLNATSPVGGAFTYSPAAGTIPLAGTDTLSVTFTPTDAVDYTTASKSVSLVVNQATPIVTWATPASISAGTALGGAQLNATASVPGTFAYTPAAGSIPSGGTDTLSVLFTPTDTADYTTATQTVSLLVTATVPMITWPTPVPIQYGTALGSSQLNATSTVAGTFSYIPAAGTVLTAGSYTLNTTFTPTDMTSYSTATKSVSLTVNPAPLSVAANNVTRVYGTANPSFTGTVAGGQSSDNLVESFSTLATPLSNVGIYTIVPSVTGSNLASYTETITSGSLRITQAGSGTTLRLSSGTLAQGQSLTLTVQIASSTSGTPTGNVQFFDGTTLLNLATLSGGTATYSTSALTVGTHSLTAVYLGDTNFAVSTSGTAQIFTVSGTLDFTLSSITPSNTVLPGAVASYSFQIAPTSGVYPSSVIFAATGLPPGATATFSPSTIAANAGLQNVVVNIQTTAMSARVSGQRATPFRVLALSVLLLPLAGTRRRSRQWLASTVWLIALFLGGALMTFGLSGCGSSNGFFGEAPRSYTVTLTASSGAVEHAVTVTLNVQ